MKRIKLIGMVSAQVIPWAAGAGLDLSLFDPIVRSLSDQFVSLERNVNNLNQIVAAISAGAAAVVPNESDFSVHVLRGQEWPPRGLGFVPAVALAPIIIKAGSAVLGAALLTGSVAMVTGYLRAAKQIESEIHQAQNAIEKQIIARPELMPEWRRYKAQLKTGGPGIIQTATGSIILVLGFGFLAWWMFRNLGRGGAE